MSASDALDPVHAAFVQGPVSINVASCNAASVPSVARATGCRVSADRRRLTLFLSRTQAPALLADIASTARIAAVFSAPPTHRTIQLKGADATIGSLEPGDAERIEAYAEAFSVELADVGFLPALGRTVVAAAPDDLVAVTFTPDAAFQQTPGPGAGAPLPR